MYIQKEKILIFKWQKDKKYIIKKINEIKGN